MHDTVYDYMVIGKGLLGAAAARHLSAVSKRVALIGPDEPMDRASHRGTFGSHYDEGRITRILDPDRTWALLAQRSIARYRDIESQSGLPFYHEVGHLMVSPAPQATDDIVLMELDAAEVARLRGMPSIIYRPWDTAERCYILPPIRYPDGNTM